MTDRPPVRVTIVIPTHDDDPTHLHEAVSSALDQTHEAVEVIVVDDGSTRPDKLTQLDRLADVMVIRQDNAGPSAARDTGIAAGTGDVVICLDADDILSPEFASQAVTILDSDPLATVAYPRVEPFGQHPSPVWPTRGDLTLADFAQRSAVPVSSAFRRAQWASTAGWDARMRTGMEDHEWWVRFFGQHGGRAVPMPSAVLGYRIRQGSRSRTRPYAEDLAMTRRHILENNPAPVLVELLTGAWAATDAAEAEAARAWSDRWQLRRWARAVQRRVNRLPFGRRLR